MPRKRLTLQALVEAGAFDPGNFRHRRALDESGPLADPELERVRENVVELRRVGARVRAAETLREFGRRIADRPRG